MVYSIVRFGIEAEIYRYIVIENTENSNTEDTTENIL